MNVSVENVAPCRKLVRVEVEPQKVDEVFEQVIHDFRKRAVLPGFRPGKAPRDVVERRFQKDIEEDVRRELLRDCLDHLIKDEHLRLLRTENIEVLQFGRGRSLQAVLTVETEPEFALPEYKGLRIKREIRSVTDDDVNRALDLLRRQRIQYNKVDRPAATGDIAVINYRATVEGRPLLEVAPEARSLAEANGFWVTVDSKSFLPGFGEQLLGARAGDRRTIHLLFPPDLPHPPLAGRPAAFEVEVLEIKEAVLPPLDDELARSFGAQNLEELRAGVRRDLENELKHKLERQVRVQLLRHLLDRVHFELPDSALERETRQAVYEIVRENTKRGVSRETIEKEKDIIYEAASRSARDRVKIGFILQRIAEKEGIGVTEEEISRRIVVLAALHQVPASQLARDLKERGALPEIYDEILRDKVLDFLQKHAQIEDVPPDQLPMGLAIGS
ncbi:MAG: trigger factor [Verrucomicrobiota bacterium]|nr:trigger factor [Limisphaera sp.]MDW8382296.1 trigger factor [Verrucomicrobiota bacterium]